MLKKGRAKKFLTKLQKLAQHLGSPHTDGILKRRANKRMLIDMLTRWGSTFLMLQRLVDLKCFVQDLGSHESYLTESEWAEVKMMIEVLQISHAATIYFQKQDSLRENACFIGEKSCLNWRSWKTIWLLLLPPSCNHAKSFFAERGFLSSSLSK